MESLLLSLVEERNARETLPYIEIHASNEHLWRQVDEWKQKCDELERQLVLARENGDVLEKTSSQHQQSSRSESAALRNERKMREQMERLEEQLQQLSDAQQRDTQTIQNLTKERDDLKAIQNAHDKTMSKLQEENDKQSRAIEHLTMQKSDYEQRTNLAEQQYAGLKDAIRTLQEENDSLKKENRQLESRLVSEKERLSSEMNILTDMIERLKRQAEMAKTLQQHEEKRNNSSWFGLAPSSSTADKTTKQAQDATPASPAPSKAIEEPPTAPLSLEVEPKERAIVTAIVPSNPKHMISAHYKEASCVR
jgi:chromosome segregation ATPase